MEPAIWPGDYILLDKTVPGARIFRNFDLAFEGSRPDMYRCPGRRAVRRNDVLVFNFPYSDWHRLTLDMNVYYMKRCVALPGDTFRIENGIYRVAGCADALGCYDKQLMLSGWAASGVPQGLYRSFSSDDAFGWNVLHFDPLYLPRQGDDLVLTPRHYALYEKPIEYETGLDLRCEQGQYFLGDSLITSYTFRTNYYFMAGAHVFDSKDSRYWGLLPEDHIVDRAAVVWKSVDMETGRLRWKRMFRRVK